MGQVEAITTSFLGMTTHLWTGGGWKLFAGYDPITEPSTPLLLPMFPLLFLWCLWCCVADSISAIGLPSHAETQSRMSHGCTMHGHASGCGMAADLLFAFNGRFGTNLIVQ